MVQAHAHRPTLPLAPSLVALIAGAAALIVAGVVVAVIASRQPAASYPADSPQGTVATYLRLLQDGQVDEAYAVTSFEPAQYPGPYPGSYPLLAPMSRDQFHQAFDGWSQVPHQVVLLRSSTAADRASVTVEIASFRPDLLGGDLRSHVTFTLVRTAGTWRITGPSYLAP